MTSLVLKKHSHPVEYFPTTAATVLGLGVTSKNEQVKQIRVNFYLFKNSNVNYFGIVDSFSQHILQVPSFNKFVNADAKNEVGYCASH